MTKISSTDIIKVARARYQATQMPRAPYSFPSSHFFELDDGDIVLVEEIVNAVNAALEAREDALAVTIRRVAETRTSTPVLDNVIAKQVPTQREIGDYLTTYEKIANVLGFEPASTAAILDTVIANHRTVHDDANGTVKVLDVFHEVNAISHMMNLPDNVAQGVKTLAACWERQKKALDEQLTREGVLRTDKAKATEACAKFAAENERLEKDAIAMRASITALQNDLQRTRQASDNKDGVIARKDDTIAEISRQRMLAATELRDFKERFETVRRALTP